MVIANMVGTGVFTSLGFQVVDIKSGFPVVHTAAFVVLLFTALHCWSIVWGSRFNNVLTALKVILLLVFIVAAFRVPAAQDVTFLPRPGDFDLVLPPAFAVSLVYVAFAYTGWNPAVYIVGEMEDPRRHLPRALLTGTAVVLVLYALVNYAFMHTVPFAVLPGQSDGGYFFAC